MAVSTAVRRYYAERIVARTTRDRPAWNFRPLGEPPTGYASVEGCRGGGKNVLEVFLLGEGGRVKDLRVACGLCNPAMYVAADLVADWARGRPMDEILALDPLDLAALGPFFDRLGGPGRPDDLREKLQYAILTLRRAIHAHRGEAAPPLPLVAEPREVDLDDEDAE